MTGDESHEVLVKLLEAILVELRGWRVLREQLGAGLTAHREPPRRRIGGVEEGALTVEDVVRLLKVSKSTVCRHIRRGAIPATEFGRQWVVERALLLETIRHDSKQRDPRRQARIQRTT